MIRSDLDFKKHNADTVIGGVKPIATKTPASLEVNPVAKARQALSQTPIRHQSDLALSRSRLAVLKASSVKKQTTFNDFEADYPQAVLPKKKRFAYKQLFRRSVLAFQCVLICLMIAGSIATYQFVRRPKVVAFKVQEVAGVNIQPDQYAEEYKKWSVEQFQAEKRNTADEDGDGLTNYEEFLLRSDPNNANQCGNIKNDGWLLIEGTNPTTCAQFNWDDENQRSLYESFMHTALRKDTINKEIQKTNSILQAAADGVPADNPELYNTDDINQLKSNLDQIQSKINAKVNSRTDTVNLARKIDSYILLNRSYEPYDRNYEVPVKSEIFITISEKYNVPLKYVLTLAKLESRFGTDRFDDQGALTRPGQYQNMYSIGLDDSGNNATFGGWEAGVEAFGKWYRTFDDRGIDDCRKWRIYNPNGDYCAKVEENARDIELQIRG
jgi:hypothetical protein